MSILNSDSVALVDTLGRKKFAKQIINSLNSSFEIVDESIVVGVCGKWGCGKTTLLSYISSELDIFYNKDEDKYRIINFNSWSNSGEDELQRNFLETIIKTLDDIKWVEPLDEVNNSFKKYLKYLNYLKFVKHIHPIVKNIFDAIDDYISKEPILSLDEIKAKANKLILEKKIKLYIFIDDLDRLTSAEITNIFKTLKLNVNFLNTFYFIAYDKPIVINALKNQYGDNAETYLEKIIQADFSIPEILEDQIENLFFEKLKEILNNLFIVYEERFIYSLWRHHGLREYFKTIRDIKRFFNSVILSLPNIKNDINIYDFVALEAIKVFDYNAYENLYSNFLIIQRKGIWTDISFDNNIISSDYPSPTTQSLLNHLFVFKNTYNISSSLNARRLRNPEFFQRYYTLYTATRDINEEIIEQFFVEGSNTRQLLSEILRNGKMKNFLRRLSDTELNNYYTITNINIFHQFLHFWDNNESAITSELDEYLWNSYFNLAHSFDDKFLAARTAVSALNLSSSSLQPMKFVFNHYILVFKNTGRIDRQFHGTLGEQIQLSYSEIESYFLEYIKKVSTNYFYKGNEENCGFTFNLFIYSFAKYFPLEYEKELDKYLVYPNFLKNFLKTNFLMIDLTTGKPGRINLQNKDLLLPRDLFTRFKNALSSIRKGAISDLDFEYVNFFLKEIAL